MDIANTVSSISALVGVILLGFKDIVIMCLKKAKPTKKSKTKNKKEIKSNK